MATAQKLRTGKMLGIFVGKIAEKIPEINFYEAKNKFLKHTLTKKSHKQNPSSQEEQCLAMLDNLSMARITTNEKKVVVRDVTANLGKMKIAGTNTKPKEEPNQDETDEKPNAKGLEHHI